MKRDIKEQFLKFTGQEDKLTTRCYRISFGECWVYLLDKDRTIQCNILSYDKNKGRYYVTFSVTLSDFFWDINSPSKEELELFLIEHPEVHQRLFGDKYSG